MIPNEQLQPLLYLRNFHGTVRFISDLRELNKTIKCKPFPIPNVQHLSLK